jgi:hypothetical protein
MLFTLLEDNKDIDQIWDAFHHFKIDERTSKLIIHHSQQLYENAQDSEIWRQSTYGSFLKLVDDRTLSELRHHWKSYADFSKLPVARIDKLRQEQIRLSKSVLDKHAFTLSPSRSAGILWMQASGPLDKLFKRYWETGTTFALDDDIKKAKNLNPTFIYSLPGEVFDPHYGTFPQGFHLTSAFAPILSDPLGPLAHTGSAAIDVMKQQFKAWCNAFRASRAAGAITIRFFSGDAIAFSRALDSYASTGRAATDIFMSAWRAPRIIFNEPSASEPPAPTSFDIIDTSNLTDHLGLLNLLLVTQPLLKKAPASQSVLYTETLLPSGEDATQSFLDRICANVPTISALLGIAPRPYVSAFTTHSNIHELLYSDHVKQYHERVAWVDPTSGDRHASQQESVIFFNAKDLGHVIFGMYDKMFASEQVMAAMRATPSLARLKSMGEVHYHRETIAALFQLVKRRVQLKTGDWEVVADTFLEIVEQDRSRLIGMNNYQDLCLQLHLYGIHTVSPLEPNWQLQFSAAAPSKIFGDWWSVPPILCVVLTVPRKNLKALLHDKEHTGTPPLQCNLTAQGVHSNAYSAIHAVWGKSTTVPGSDIITLEEDPHGINGTSGLVVSFWASSRILQFEGTLVSLVLKSTPQTTMMFMEKLGPELAIFGANISNKQRVHLLPYRPVLAPENRAPSYDPVMKFPDPTPPDNYVSISADVNQERGQRCVMSFTGRVEIETPAEQEALSKGAEISTQQISPCTMKLKLGNFHHLVRYPYPIRGSQNKLRVARKSHYIEVSP